MKELKIENKNRFYYFFFYRQSKYLTDSSLRVSRTRKTFYILLRLLDFIKDARMVVPIRAIKEINSF